jgi:protein gp37
MHKRLTAMGVSKYSEPFNNVVCHHESLMDTLKVKTPSMFFVNSMSDLFHEDVPAEFIADVFNIMAALPLVCRKKDCYHDEPECYMDDAEKNHTYQILTKRPERALKFLTEEIYKVIENWPGDYPLCLAIDDEREWPLSNVWLGVSVEDQKAADERIPTLCKIPAATKFVSCEPLLGPVDLMQIDISDEDGHALLFPLAGEWTFEGRNEPLSLSRGGIDWVIAGGESGKAKDIRPMHPDWVRSLRDQCKAADVPFFFKQWGEFKPILLPGKSLFITKDEYHFMRVGKKKAGALLDGVQYKEFPME